MNAHHRSHACSSGTISWCLGVVAFLVAMPMAFAQVTTLSAGNTLLPVLPASAGSVGVAQQPLTARKMIPPNLVLMLDDSGSMARNVMPDWNYLSGTSQSELRDPSVNGVYFNPAVTYEPPPKADGVSSYLDADFGAALFNGFNSTSQVVDLSTYEAEYDDYSINYSESFGSIPTGTVATAQQDGFNAPSNCPAGTRASGSQDEYCYYDSDPSTVFFEFYATVSSGTWYVSKCNTDGYIYNKTNNTCLVKNNISISDSCPSGTTQLGKTTIGYNENRKICTKFKPISFFVYTAGGTTHYVGKSGMCAKANLASTICVDPSQTSVSDPSIAPGMSAAEVLTNVANWFSYYHTRMLLARSGVMRAFIDLNSKFRVGFASINGTGASWINSHTTSPFEFRTGTNNNNYLAGVETFGNGSTGTRKAQFWDWIANRVRPNNNTPLRSALQGAGEYYETAQPWQSINSVSGNAEMLACRQSYTILTTDGFWNSDQNFNIGNVDAGTNSQGGPAIPVISDPNGGTYQYQPAAPFKDSYSNTLADVAMYYWMHDLADNQGSRPDIDNELTPNSVDPAFWQHMVSFTMGMGFTPSDAAGNPIDDAMVDGLLAWSQGGAQPSGWGGWPQPSSGSAHNIADLVHASVNGHGRYFSATTPDKFISGLKTALKQATQRLGAGASLAANSTQLKSGAMIYQGLYHTAIWTGELKAYELIVSGSHKGEINAPPQWNAATAMPAPNARNIYTYKLGASSYSTGYVQFANSGSTPPSLSAAQLSALGTSSADRVKMVDYLRGDASNEERNNGTFRNRSYGILGDIINSQPVYVGSPTSSEFIQSTFAGSDQFVAYATAQAARDARIYVAANDGMLHAFDASNGAEKFAYIPGAIITAGLAKLADPDYGTTLTSPHRYFNDGLLTEADAYFKAPGGSTAEWHSVLVGSSGRGMARVVYALDVTDPANIKLLWERSSGDGKTNSGYIGQITGQPVVAQVADGKWAVIIGNGYNSTKGSAALLQFELSSGKLKVYTTNDSVVGNGLAAPLVWIDSISTNVSTMAYAGDLKGNVWSFALNSDMTSNDAGTNIFIAKDKNGNRQPITSGMFSAFDYGNQNRWLFFGTGSYLSLGDLTDTSEQTWYGIIVDSNTSGLAVDSSTTRSDLAKRQIIAVIPGSTTGTTVEPATRVISQSHATDPNTPSISGKSGWYIDLLTPGLTNGNATNVNNPVASGERMVLTNQLVAGHLFGTSWHPDSSNVCSPSGTGAVMAVDMFTGTNPEESLFDINGDGVVDADDKVTVGGHTYVAAGFGVNALPYNSTTVGTELYTPTAKGQILHKNFKKPASSVSRVSWREMVNL